MKTYIIETHYCNQERRVNAVMLCRNGRAVKTVLVNGESEQTSAFWDLRKHAKGLGATHVRILGTREPVDA